MSTEPGFPAAGFTLPARTLTLTRADVVRYAGASTDFNPIHFSDRFARQVGMDQVIVHGMWTMGAALGMVTDWLGDPSLVKEYFVRFTRPIPVPDTDAGTQVQFSGTITDVTEGIATIAIEATHEGAKVLGAARAIVALPRTVADVGRESA